MPLYMDYHKGLSVSIEDVKKAHIADEAVQSRYGVVYHQFWLNERDGTVFCLMEGPDKESCEAVHREAHGNIACSIVEVSTGFYELFMGHRQFVDGGLVVKPDGSADQGTRCVLILSVKGLTTVEKSSDYKSLSTPLQAKKLANAIIRRHNGREVQRLIDDSLVTVFDSPAEAVTCAVSLRKEFIRQKTTEANHEWNIAFRIGVSAGQPLTETGDLFSEAVALARRLCSVASDNQVLVAASMQDLCNVAELAGNDPMVRMLGVREEDFISRLFAISEEKLSDDSFTVDALSRRIGMSRPQLYRKIVSLTGKSPNDFIRDLRMVKALALIRQKAGNISEIALEVGYNNPSYFARCFQMRFGCTPSRLIQ